MKNEMNLEKLKYPIGRFRSPDQFSQDAINKWIQEIEELPALLTETVKDLNDEQLDTPYREGGWTVRQIIHHIGDSHLNSYVRFKLALTENQPTIKPYDQKLWADLPDYSLYSIKDSLKFVDLLHKRWVIILKSLSKDQLNRGFLHPESGLNLLYKTIGVYAWHGNHHLSQIKALIQRKVW